MACNLKSSTEFWKQPRFQYSIEAMDNAICAVQVEGMSVLRASKQFGVPRSTLISKLTGKSPNTRKMGPATILSQKEEDKLVEWILKIAKVGFPLIREDLLATVQKIVTATGRKNPFTDNKSGKKWFQLFLNRHPEIRLRVPETLTYSKADISESQLRLWFAEIHDWLCANEYDDILKYPERIFNCDESAFMLCPKSGKVLGLKGTRDIYEVFQGSEKESLTTLMTIRADGIICSPFIIYPYVRLPADLVNTAPKDWGIGKSESGWMTSETFYEYIANVFHPWLLKSKVPLPILLFIDGHKSHLTLHLSDFCSENGIVLIALPPNSTHILQPCDVSLFRGMKQTWKKIVHEWRAQNSRIPVTKNNFAQLFSTVVENITPETVINGFRRCGIFPFNPDAVDYSKCSRTPGFKKSYAMNSEQKHKEKKRCIHALQVMESFINEDLLRGFNTCFDGNETWTDPERAVELYAVWEAMKRNHQSFSETSFSNVSSVDLSFLNTSAQNDVMEVSQCSSVSNKIEVGATEVGVNPSTSEISDINQDVHLPLESFPINVEPLSTVVIEDSGSSTSPFKRVLFWPEPKKKQLKKRTTQKMPAVATSNEWKKLYKQKEEEKKNKEEQKQKRKLEREKKKQEKLEPKNKKKQEKLEPKNKKNQEKLEPKNKKNSFIPRQKRKRKSPLSESSEVESETNIMYEDSSDLDSNLDLDEGTENVCTKIKCNIQLKTEYYYAVYYDEKFYIGRILEVNEECCTITFLQEIMENSYTWPLKADNAVVKNCYIFYGPLTLIGNDPFSVDIAIIRKIKTAYRQMKKQ